MFEIGQSLTKENYTPAAIWCNQNGAHIEKQNSVYVIAANPAPAEPTAQELVQTKEAQTGLTRPVRELVLAENSGASEYVKELTHELETWAAVLRE